MKLIRNYRLFLSQYARLELITIQSVLRQLHVHQPRQMFPSLAHMLTYPFN